MCRRLSWWYECITCTASFYMWQNKNGIGGTWEDVGFQRNFLDIWPTFETNGKTEGKWEWREVILMITIWKQEVLIFGVLITDWVFGEIFIKKWPCSWKLYFWENIQPLIRACEICFMWMRVSVRWRYCHSSKATISCSRVKNIVEALGNLSLARRDFYVVCCELVFTLLTTHRRIQGNQR